MTSRAEHIAQLEAQLARLRREAELPPLVFPDNIGPPPDASAARIWAQVAKLPLPPGYRMEAKSDERGELLEAAAKDPDGGNVLVLSAYTAEGAWCGASGRSPSFESLPDDEHRALVIALVALLLWTPDRTLPNPIAPNPDRVPDRLRAQRLVPVQRTGLRGPLSDAIAADPFVPYGLEGYTDSHDIYRISDGHQSYLSVSPDICMEGLPRRQLAIVGLWYAARGW